MSRPAWVREVLTMRLCLLHQQAETGFAVHLDGGAVSLFAYDGKVPDLGVPLHLSATEAGYTVRTAVIDGVGFTVFCHDGPEETPATDGAF